MNALRRLIGWIGRSLDRIDERIDKPAKAHGTYLQGSETMIDDEMAAAKGEAVGNKRAGYGRGI